MSGNGIEIEFFIAAAQLSYPHRSESEQDLSAVEWATRHKTMTRSHVIRTYENAGIPMVVVHQILVGAEKKFTSAHEMPNLVAADVLENNPSDPRLRPRPGVDDMAFVQRQWALVEAELYLATNYWAIAQLNQVRILTPTKIGSGGFGANTATVAKRGSLPIASY